MQQLQLHRVFIGKRKVFQSVITSGLLIELLVFLQQVLQVFRSPPYALSLFGCLEPSYRPPLARVSCIRLRLPFDRQVPA